MPQPWSAFPKVISQLAVALEDADLKLVQTITKELAVEVRKQGGKYHIRGRGGTPVRLGAKSNIKGHVGNVSGDPAGFWRIVTDGSRPHLIAGTRRATGRRRSQSTLVRRFVNVDASFGDTRPLQLGSIGFRQYANHPGHTGFGDPWRKALNHGDDIVTKAHYAVTDKLLVAAWNH